VSAFELAVRISAAVGSFDETTWTAPGVELVGRLDTGGAFFGATLGYVPIDSHVNLADGEIVHGSLAGGIARGRVRLAATFDLAYVAYHGDPDVLVRHPGVDLVVRQGGVVPSLGGEAAYRFTAALSAGGFVRGALRELVVYDGGGGDVARASLVLVGAFLDVRLR